MSEAGIVTWWALLVAAALSRRFGERIAVEGLDFEVREGEIFALLGPNGAGKTTTLRMLAALIAPSAGRLTLDGIPYSRRTAGALRARIGLLTEAPGLWERLTVRTNLLVHGRLHGLARPDADVDDALRRFDLWERRDEPAAVLSKGMKQKVALARALLHAPSLVLLDEPTSGLDPEMARSVRELVLGLRAQGRAVVLSTHNLDEAERLADRVAVLRQRIIAVDTPAALRSRLFGRRVRIELEGDAAAFAATVKGAGGNDVRVEPHALSVALRRGADEVPAIVRALVMGGAAIRAVVEEQRTLEDVYLRLMQRDQDDQNDDAGRG